MTVRILTGDCREVLPTLDAGSVHCCVTSPPYWGLRDYGHDAQIGLEPTPDEYVAQLVAVFREVRRVLRDDGTLWLNIGDSYAGSWGNQGRKQERGTQRPINGEMLSKVHDNRYPSQGSNTGKIPEGSGLKPKDLVGIPWRVALALQADGWWLRSDIVWTKPKPTLFILESDISMRLPLAPNTMKIRTPTFQQETLHITGQEMAVATNAPSGR